MNIFNKILVLTEAEITAIAAILGGDPILPSIGKKLSHIYGKDKTYNEHYWYSIEILADRLINNPDHPMFGKYAVLVAQADVDEYIPDYSDQTITIEQLGDWRASE